jgi:hypothetical protein
MQAPELIILASGPTVQIPKGITASIYSEADFQWGKFFTPELLTQIRELREEIRRDEGADGQCLWVCEAIEAKRLIKGHLEVVYGAYLNEVGEPICDDHFWLQLSDGSWFDPTCDQFGEGHDMRLIPAGSPMMARFRTPCWSDEYNPSLADEFPELAGVEWSGMTDLDWYNKLRDERGAGWWLEYPDLKAAWEARGEAYQGPSYGR